VVKSVGGYKKRRKRGVRDRGLLSSARKNKEEKAGLNKSDGDAHTTAPGLTKGRDKRIINIRNTKREPATAKKFGEERSILTNE